MIKRLFLAVFLTAALTCAQATVTVTANLKTLTGVNATSSTKVIATLRGCGLNTPTVPGVGVIDPSPVPFTPNLSTGVVTMTLWSKSEVNCGGVSNVTYYDIELQNNGVSQWKRSYAFTVSGDLSQMLPITTAPVTTPPTGDNSYLRLDVTNAASWAGTTWLPLRAVFSNSGAVLTAGTACGVAPRSGTISAITLQSDGTVGNATIDFSTQSFAQFLAGSAATSMTSSHPVTFTAARGIQTSTFTGWSTLAVTAGNVYCMTLSSPTAITQLTVTVTY